MADKEHLEILGQGVEVWNQWREENPDVLPDLRGAKLHGTNLEGAKLYKTDLCGADLGGADLSGADLRMADLRWADLSRADLSGANLRRAHLNGANLGEADLSGANLRRVNLEAAKLRKADLREADLSEADLRDAHLSEADLSEADLSEADLRWARLIEADLREADLHGARLIEADLSGANFSGANFSLADLIEADLRRASLIKADLRGADLRWARLIEADLSRADLRWARLIEADLSRADLSKAEVGYTVLANLDLSVVKGLETIEQRGPSFIDIHTIYRSRGKIPEVFLHGCGVPANFIAYMGSLTGKAFEYYSCFISYSTNDEAFAQRLHADLQQNNVHCWFAPEDMKIGDDIWARIDQTIRLHDKLLVVLSKNSISSSWVKDEVETAFEEERQRDQTVLFPVMLDDAVMGTDKPWAAKIRRRHIGDFRHWKDHDSYHQAFDRLLRDLKASEA